MVPSGRNRDLLKPQLVGAYASFRPCGDERFECRWGGTLLREREVVAQVHSIKRRVLPSGKVTFDAERTTRGGHADKFWAIALACQKERARERRSAGTVGVRVLG
jgi:hypothetical protein